MTVASGKLDSLPPRLAALCRYARKLTLKPQAIEVADIERLRAHGLDDRAIVDANQVVSYFNYVNRVADGLGVELEPSWPAELRAPRTYAARPFEFPSIAADSLPWLSVAQMREVDRLTIDEFGIATVAGQACCSYSPAWRLPGRTMSSCGTCSAVRLRAIP